LRPVAAIARPLELLALDEFGRLLLVLLAGRREVPREPRVQLKSLLRHPPNRATRSLDTDDHLACGRVLAEVREKLRFLELQGYVVLVEVLTVADALADYSMRSA